MKKLVRDKIPELFDVKPTYIADDEEYMVELVKKLQEEVDEYVSDRTVEELADILEVVHALAEAHGSSVAAVHTIREAKARERGAFKRKIIWSKT